jgi:CHAD domain-containing protein
MSKTEAKLLLYCSEPPGGAVVTLADPSHVVKWSAAPRSGDSRDSPRADTVLDLVYAHLGTLAATLERQHPGAARPADPQAVHEMRITVRRLRAALRAFGALLPTAAVQRFSGELERFSSELGAVRDADVVLERIRAHGAHLSEPETRALEGYTAELEAEQTRAQRRLLETLASPRYWKLVGDLERFAAAGPSPGRRRRFGALGVRYAEKRYLAKAAAKVRRRGRRITRRARAGDLHALRIRAKRLRYLIELFAQVDGRLQKPLRACRRLQDVLGEHQDAVVAGAKLDAYRRARRASRRRTDEAAMADDAETRALALLARGTRRDAEYARDRFPDVFARFAKAAKKLKVP